MRRAAIALAASALLALSGCTLSIYNSYRDIESLEVVQALGLDTAGDGGVLLSVATGADASGREPVRLTQEAESLDGAMRGMEQLTGRGRLFFSGTGAIVLGAPAAAESARWLDAIARSKELRLDTELYVLRSGEAAGLLTSDDAPEDVFASLNALGERVRSDGPAPVPTCSDVSRSLISSGAALAAAIDVAEGADGRLTPVPAGFAILTAGGLAGWLDEDAAIGAGFFMGGPGISVVELESGVTAELAGAELSVSPVWNGGSLSGLDVSLEVGGSVIEAPADSDFSSAGSWETIEDELSGLARGWVESALDKSRELGADFLGLGREIESAEPVRFAGMPLSWEEAFPDLEIDVSCTTKILNMREYASSPYGEVGK